MAARKLIYLTIKTYESRYYYFIETIISCSATNMFLNPLGRMRPLILWLPRFHDF